MNYYSIAFLVALPIIIVVILVLSIKIVPQSEEWMLEHFGKFSRILKPGLHILNPIADRVSFKISMREHVLDVPHQDVISKDNAMVTVDGVAFYHVFDSKKAAYMVSDKRLAMAQLIITNIRTVLGEMDLNSMLFNRDIINNKLLAVVDEATDPWGIKVNRVEIKDIHPPADLQEAMSSQLKADRRKIATILEAEGDREAAILRANGKKMSAILEAEGKQEATILEAKAQKERAFLEAEARERRALAESKAIEEVSSSIGTGKGKAAQYFLYEKYIEAMKSLGTSENSKTILFPFAANNLLSSTGVMASFAKDLLQDSTK
jgi:regulator of protease activity HflC (stomatin/prohibitin superfamily)